MKRQPTILAALYKRIKFIVFTSVDAISISLNRIPGMKLTSIKTPIELLKEMPAIKINRKRFYAEAKVRLRASAIFERESTNDMLSKQREFMKQLMEENKSAIKKEAIKIFDHYKAKNKV